MDSSEIFGRLSPELSDIFKMSVRIFQMLKHILSRPDTSKAPEFWSFENTVGKGTLMTL